MKNALIFAALLCSFVSGAKSASGPDNRPIFRSATAARWEYAEVYDYADGRYLFLAGKTVIQEKDFKKFIEALATAGVIDKLPPGSEATIPTLLDALGDRGWEMVSKSLDRQVFEGCKTFKRLKS
ncbi:MAG: hypothetical protein ABIV50_04450 [Opitutus sp.]